VLQVCCLSLTCL
jgi:hypothetical protein